MLQWKKKAHTGKSLILSGHQRRIDYISSLQQGSQHDFTILQQCFVVDKSWFKDFELWLDMGFQGFAGKYRYETLHMPIKKKKPAKGEDNELSEEQKAWNKLQASGRISIEHCIGGMKRYRILSNRLRLKTDALIDTVIGVCAGLWNFVLN